jgi:hypothetical protein
MLCWMLALDGSSISLNFLCGPAPRLKREALLLPIRCSLAAGERVARCVAMRFFAAYRGSAGGGAGDTGAGVAAQELAMLVWC